MLHQSNFYFMEKEIKEYQIVSGGVGVDIDAFVRLVMEQIEQHWQPIGGIFYQSGWVQAMIR